MADFQIDLRDVRFNLFEWLKIQDALEGKPLFEGQGQEMWEMVIDEAAKLAKEVLAPLDQVGDVTGCKWSEEDGGTVRMPPGFKEAYAQYAEGGWVNPTGDPEWGGMALPTTLAAAAGDNFIGANTSFMFTPGLTGAAARVILARGSQELRETYVLKMNTGKWSGTMCLTEPQAGSAVGDSTTKAEPQADGSYLIAGTKIFISNGEQDITENIIHLVLARAPDAPPGTKGLSLFVVPKYFPDSGERNDVKCTGIEEKMGIHGSSTASLAFGEEGACKGWIIGDEGEGMRHMFLMMNEARLEVGIQGVAIGNSAFQRALAYARERIQGPSVREFRNPEAPRVAIIEHPNVRRMLMECKALGEGSRALLYKAAHCLDLEHIAETDEELERAEAYVGLLTPVVKAYCSEAGMRMADVAMQVLGGYGYIKEYGIEQNLRDVKIAQIYEGTNSIQALDLIARKIGRKGGQHLMWLMSDITTFITANLEHYGLGAEVKKLQTAQNALIKSSMAFGGFQMQGDVEYPVLLCKEYLVMFGDVMVGWYLLEHAVISSSRLEEIQEEDPEASPNTHSEARFYDAKVNTARFFVHQILPRVLATAGRIESGDRSALNVVF